MPLRMTAAVESFLAENELGTLTTLRPDGSPHVAPVRFTWDGEAGLVRVMTAADRRKARNVRANPGGRASICQVVGPRWITMEGAARVFEDPRWVSEGVRRYAKRYWAGPPDVPGLVVIEIAIDRVMGLY
ncbi:pyridoxamine 5'-phosphate oxidase family protein [Amorphoplanes digitatis]|uniref:PPOX class probable F420-dependent enzyme n=1 Tax=Actinoplanes digitatis TaxID=1868 RepID=A0A7W7I1C4_9ACTN|nr:TIGR03618 family F420-dependent PPOX class oxidoreductase [Actinoplanes digitatis]MBB4764461.1 PPOX class probable F420-dependent enzyme [Actinoplanes digitatis]BFE73909.1 TIGR03618 family F420-dependent PPOX class oxidoreductase [Actinoplanes digitatis]GID94052.1 PPOX class F420-dependent enzyme [Actinoplanes digitatis]